MTKPGSGRRVWRWARAFFVVVVVGAVSLLLVGVVASWQDNDARQRDAFGTVFERSVLSVSEVLGEPDLSESGDFAWHEGSVDTAWWDTTCDTRGPVRWPLDEVHLLRVLRRIESIAVSERGPESRLYGRETRESISSDTAAIFGVTNHAYATWLTAGMDDGWFRLSVFDC